MQDSYPHGTTARDSEDAAKLAAFQRDHEAREAELTEES